MPRRQHFWAGWFFTTTCCWQGWRWFKLNCKCCLLFMWSGEFEMRISAELHAKKHLVVRYRQIEICKTAWLKMWSAFIYVYFVDNSDAVKANSALQEDTKSQISDDFVLICWHHFVCIFQDHMSPTKKNNIWFDLCNWKPTSIITYYRWLWNRTLKWEFGHSHQPKFQKKLYGNLFGFS